MPGTFGIHRQSLEQFQPFAEECDGFFTGRESRGLFPGYFQLMDRLFHLPGFLKMAGQLDGDFLHMIAI
jgi:hypothetical protein